MSDVQAEAQEAPEREAAPDIEAHEDQQPVETHESVVRVAQAMGWAPKEKWKGRADGWVDAETFLTQQPARLKRVQEQVETVSKTTERMAQETLKRRERELRAELAQATEAGDVEAVQAAADQLAEVRTPKIDPAEVQRKFRERNSWFGVDDEATAIAEAAAGRVAAKGIQDPDQQLAAAERAVRKAMPELFDDEAPEDRPSRSSPSKAAPAVQGGQRASNPAPREKGFADLPGHVKAAVTDKRLAFYGLPPGKEGREQWARIYHEEQEKAR